MSSAPKELTCVVCDAATPRSDAKTARIRSNIRRFSNESFDLWQCAKCGSLHAADEVDLAAYYAHYPFHGQQINAPTRLAYAGKLRTLEKLGLKRHQRILDYGCGGGVFVQFLQERGYPQATGYDPYVHEGPSSVPPSGKYDAVLSQDVIEHVDNPREHLQTLIDLTLPGGLIVVGTPNAAVVEMDAPAPYIHVLHQPFHRHILSLAALERLARSLGLELLEVKPGFIGNRRLPGLNGRFLRRILKAQGDVLDDMVDGKTPWKLELFTPSAVWDALTGSFRDPGHDMSVAFRTPSAR